MRIIYGDVPGMSEKDVSLKIYSILTDIYKERPHSVNNYIDSPKENGYQSFHVKLLGDKGVWEEIHISSERMVKKSQFGCIAERSEGNIVNWIEKFKSVLQDVACHGKEVEYMEGVTMSFYNDDIMVYTPQGMYVILPKNATALDFAFEIHSNIGKHAQYAKINGYTPSHFSFNMDGGRCPECQGEGFVKIGMQFMADVSMVCEACGGKRFKPDILEVRYKGVNIDDILNMSVDEAITFFGSQDDPVAKRIAERLQPLVDVGLSYIKLGQSSSTLSGGESQRIKLAYFLSMNDTGSKVKNQKILFIFDEPTTGLHFYDVEKLLKSFDALLAKGHSIVVVEHNLDVIKAADWVIDLGPEAGDAGGNLVFAGTPEQLMECKDSHTATYLR